MIMKKERKDDDDDDDRKKKMDESCFAPWANGTDDENKESSWRSEMKG